MRRETSIPATVYKALFPHPTPTDPPDFSAHLAKNLVAEVRIETQRFYGGLETVEARYPGLNYSHPPHRKRLARFPHHARLFAAFDTLGLTEHEIAQLCRWEGTLWARQRYERDEGITVADTTGTEIKPWVDRRPVKAPRPKGQSRRQSPKAKAEVRELEDSSSGSERATPRSSPVPPSASARRPVPPPTTFGEHLARRVGARASGDFITDPAWEQFLKEAEGSSGGASTFLGDVSSSYRASTLGRSDGVRE